MQSEIWLETGTVHRIYLHHTYNNGKMYDTLVYFHVKQNKNL